MGTPFTFQTSCPWRIDVGRLSIHLSVFLLLSACAMQKTGKLDKSDSSSLRNIRQDSLGLMSSQIQKKISFQFSDSTKNFSVITIIPLGPFHYSPQSGFSGSASSLQISGNSEQWEALRGLEQTTSETEQLTSQTIDSKVKERIRAKEKVSEKKMSGKWIGWVIGIFLSLALLLGLYKYYLT